MMVPLRLVDTMAGLVAVQVHQEIRFLWYLLVMAVLEFVQ
jgi:hypothetical protein